MAVATETNQLSNEDYDFICRLVYDRSRINLGRDKKTLVTSRLGKRLRQLQLGGFGEYCDLLRSAVGEEELSHLIDRISTNHTHFFREQKHFDFLRHTVLPRWSAANKPGCAQFRLWSAASSSGEEPYSLAIWLAEHLAPAASGRWFIEGTDISTRVLEKARQAIYDSDKLHGTSLELLRRHFQKGTGEREGFFRVKEELRAQVRFQHLNLLSEAYPFREHFDVIFCRNVMIYFDKATQEQLVRQLSNWLVPGGYLMVGHSESLSGIKHSLRLVQPAIYLKAAR